MAEEQTTTQKVYISLDNLSLYDRLLRSYMNAEDKKALKTVTISEDGKKLLFYTVSQPIGETSPAFEIEIPEPPLDSVMPKVPEAVSGNIGTFNSGGTIVDSGVAIGDLVTIETMVEEIARQIAMSSALKKEIVTELPTIANAKENTIYMIKDETVEKGDAYEEWMLINGELIQIGSTSISLEGYDTSKQVDDKISTAKQEAINSAVEQAATDAQAKADEALKQAKAYTDTKVKDYTDEIAQIKTNIQTNADNIAATNLMVEAHGERLAALEEFDRSLVFATDEDIQSLFTS